MRRVALAGRRAALVAAVAVVPSLIACEVPVTAPLTGRSQVFQAALADGQALPAQRSCPSPIPGMETGADFTSGELVLYPERAFTWRYTIRQYAAAGGTQQSWTETTVVRGTYALDGNDLTLSADEGTRNAVLMGDEVQLIEEIPCPYPISGERPLVAQLELLKITGP